MQNSSSEIIRCPDLNDPPNGRVNQTGNKPGDTADYECDDGFKLVGDKYRECLKTGDFDGEEPICKSNDVMFKYFLYRICRCCIYNDIKCYSIYCF